MTLLGLSEEPATLNGYGPIEPETARRWAGEATSWVRILTHPITGTVLDLDRKTSADNTAPLCKPHHRLKSETRWRPGIDPETGRSRWASPTGFTRDPDPPPW